MTKAKKPQRIVRVQVENFKKIKVLDVRPNRYVTKFSGANGAGKTSALDAALQALFPMKKIPVNLLRQGEKKGYIRLELDDYRVSREFNDRENGAALTVQDKNTGEFVDDPQQWLKQIGAAPGYDPLRFMLMDAEDQFETLKRLVPMNADIDALEASNENDERAQTQRRIERDRLKGAATGIVIDAELPEQPIDVQALFIESESMEKHNRAIDDEERKRIHEDRDHARQVQTIEELNRKIQSLTQQLATEQAVLDQFDSIIKDRQPLPERKDRQQIANQISEATTKNQRIAINIERVAQLDQINERGRKVSDELETTAKTINDRKLAIARALQTAQFPVPGLSFETQEVGSGKRALGKARKVVTYNGLYLDDLSTSEKIRISAAIGMAAQPDVRMMVIRDGSLLDDNGWAVLEEMAHKHDFQILAEVVDTSGKVGVYIEDGQVKAINAEPEPEAQPAMNNKRKTQKVKE